MIKKYETIRRITITGEMEGANKAESYCFFNGYRIMRSGAYSNQTGVDPKRFLIVAEKKIK